MDEHTEHRGDDRRPPAPAHEVQRARDESERRKRSKQSAASARIAFQHQWVEEQLRVAQERGDFDDLPGYGKPLRLTEEHDPDWWLKGLVERERLSVPPPAIALRRADAELDDELDRLGTPDVVRRAVGEFNERVRHTLYSNPGGPPVVTSQRDPDTEVGRWHERREARRAAQRAHLGRHAGDADGAGDAGDADGAGDAGAAGDAGRHRRRRHWWRRATPPPPPPSG